jgi:hypothetical protein
MQLQQGHIQIIANIIVIAKNAVLPGQLFRTMKMMEVVCSKR